MGLEVSRTMGPEVFRKMGPEVSRKMGPECHPILLMLHVATFFSRSQKFKLYMNMLYKSKLFLQYIHELSNYMICIGNMWCDLNSTINQNILRKIN